MKRQRAGSAFPIGLILFVLLQTTGPTAGAEENIIKPGESLGGGGGDWWAQGEEAQAPLAEPVEAEPQRAVDPFAPQPPAAPLAEPEEALDVFAEEGGPFLNEVDPESMVPGEAAPVLPPDSIIYQQEKEAAFEPPVRDDLPPGMEEAVAEEDTAPQQRAQPQSRQRGQDQYAPDGRSGRRVKRGWLQRRGRRGMYGQPYGRRYAPQRRGRRGANPYERPPQRMRPPQEEPQMEAFPDEPPLAPEVLPEGVEPEAIPQEPTFDEPAGEFDEPYMMEPEGSLAPPQPRKNIALHQNVRFEATMEQRVVAAINRVRESHGLTKLANNRQLLAAGRSHSAEMLTLGYFDHDSPNRINRTFVERIKRQGVREIGTAGENIAMGTEYGGDPVKRFVQGWLESPGHRANILKPVYRYTGVGIAVKGNMVYATQLFASEIH